MIRVSSLRSFLLLTFLVLSCHFAFGQQGASDGSRKILSRVTPIYPPLARRTNVNGTVRIDALIAPDGTVKATEVVGGNPILAQAAVDAVRRWRFEPSAEQTRERIELKFNPK